MKQTAIKHKKELRCLETYKYTMKNSIEFIILTLKRHIKESLN